MVVYADILMLVNFIVDYFLISLTGKFLQKRIKFYKLLLASAVGGLFSLYIFFPQFNLFFQILIHLLMCAILSFIAFGFCGLKNFLRSVVVLFCINFAYSGAMIAVWSVFKPYGMVINNSVIYFDISPMFLIIFSVIGYFGAIFIRKVIKKPFLSNSYCFVTLTLNDRKIDLQGVVDTGNSLVDVFGLSQILITDIDTVKKILGTEINNPVRFRKIPCGTVTGERLLDGYRIDDAKIVFNNKNYNFKNPVLAVSITPILDAKIIINPDNLN